MSTSYPSPEHPMSFRSFTRVFLLVVTLLASSCQATCSVAEADPIPTDDSGVAGTAGPLAMLGLWASGAAWAGAYNKLEGDMLVAVPDYQSTPECLVVAYKIRARLEEKGVPATVKCQLATDDGTNPWIYLPVIPASCWPATPGGDDYSTTPSCWNGQRELPLLAGQYHVVQVHINDYDAAALTKKKASIVNLARTFGVSVDGMVNNLTMLGVWEEMSKRGCDFSILFI